jgi:hypothetical protein
VFSLKTESAFFEKIISRLALECQNLRDDGNLLAKLCECRHSLPKIAPVGGPPRRSRASDPEFRRNSLSPSGDISRTSIGESGLVASDSNARLKAVEIQIASSTPDRPRLSESQTIFYSRLLHGKSHESDGRITFSDYFLIMRRFEFLFLGMVSRQPAGGQSG